MRPSFIERYKIDHQHPLNRLSHYIGIPMILLSLVLFFIRFKLAIVFFIAGWIFQFVGHFIEGNQPAFFKNPIYLLIGPLFVLKRLKQALSGRASDKAES